MKQFLKKSVSLFCTAAILCGTFASCGEQKLPEPTGELSIFAPIQSDPVLLRAKSMFAKENPEVTVCYDEADKTFSTAVTYGADINSAAVREGFDRNQAASQIQEYYDSQRAALMKNGARDVVFADALYQSFDELNVLDYSKMTQSGAFCDLVPLFEKYAPGVDLERFDSLKTADGKLYAIPYRTQAFYLQSGEQLLKEWNFDCNPEDDVLTFLRKCAAWKAAAGENAPEVFSKPAWEYLYQNIFTIVGMNYVDFEKREVHFNTSEMQEILTLLRDLQSEVEESALPTPEEIGDSYGKFLFGRLYGIYDGLAHTAYGTVLDMVDKTVLMPLRTLDGKVNMQAVVYLMIPTTAQNQVNGVKYLAQVLAGVQGNGEKDARNFLIWDYDEQTAKTAESLRGYMLPYVAEDFFDVRWDMYVDRGNIRFPDYWVTGVQSLFDTFMRGSDAAEKLTAEVEDRLRIYLSE